MLITNNLTETYFQKDSDNSCHYTNSQNTMIFFEYVVFRPKVLQILTRRFYKFHNQTDLNPVDLSHGLRGCCVSEAAGPRALHGCDGGGNRQLKSSHPHQKPLMRLKGENIMFNNNFGTQKITQILLTNLLIFVKKRKVVVLNVN